MGRGYRVLAARIGSMGPTWLMRALAIIKKKLTFAFVDAEEFNKC